MFTGRTGGGANPGKIRRAVIAFDVASIISNGATIDSVFLVLHMSRTSSGTQVTTLHNALTDWGEGTSDAIDNEGSGAAAQNRRRHMGTHFF